MFSLRMYVEESSLLEDTGSKLCVYGLKTVVLVYSAVFFLKGKESIPFSTYLLSPVSLSAAGSGSEAD